MDFSLKKSFKSHGSYKHAGKISASDLDNVSKEEQPILLDQDNPNSSSMRSIQPSERREVIVRIDGDSSGSSNNKQDVNRPDNQSKIWRESSIDFWKDNERNVHNRNVGGSGGGGFEFQQQIVGEDPSKLIGQFLNKQKTRGEKSLDMDLEMDELNRGRYSPTVGDSLQPSRASSKELRVSFQSPSEMEATPEQTKKEDIDSSEEEDELRQRQQQSNHWSPNNADNGGGEVLRCTSNASFHRKSTLLRIKTRSRLMDPPEQPDLKSGRIPKSGQIPKSGPVKSGLLSRAQGASEADEDDPFFDEDVPEEYKKRDFSVLTLLQWVSLILIIAALVCSLTVSKLKSMTLWNLNLWKWEVLVLVLICGRLVSGWGIRIVVFFFERNFMLRKRVLYFVYGLRRAVQNCLWLGLVLIAWHFLFDKKVEKETDSKVLQYFTKILVCFLLGTIIWLLKTLLVKVLASSFHVSTYFDRIQESLFNQYIIETLSGPPLIEIQNNQEEEERLVAEVQKLQNAGATVPPDLRATAFPSAKSGRIVGNGGLQKSAKGKSFKLSRSLSRKQDDAITIDHLHKLNPKNVSAWNMKRLINLVRYGVISTLDEQIQNTSHDDESAMQIRSEVEAKTAARKIFRNVAKRGSKLIYLEDLMRFLREDEALKTLTLFEGASETKRISKTSLKNWVVNAFRERRALALTLNDTKTAVNRLHKMLNIVVAVLIVIIWLIILGIATSKVILFVSSQVVVAAFIFGNTLKTIFEAIIFLFVIHPFDVGDRCEIEGVQMVVEEMNILSTVFLRFDNLRIMYPNSVLATKFISNFYRSPDMGDAVEFCVHVATPAEKIALMKQRITGYIENKKEHWCPAPLIVLKDAEQLNMLRIAIWLSHRMNHQDMGERYERRSQLIEEMIKLFKEIDLQYRIYPIDINVRTMPPVTSTRVPPGWTSDA